MFNVCFSFSVFRYIFFFFSLYGSCCRNQETSAKFKAPRYFSDILEDFCCSTSSCQPVFLRPLSFSFWNFIKFFPFLPHLFPLFITTKAGPMKRIKWDLLFQSQRDVIAELEPAPTILQQIDIDLNSHTSLRQISFWPVRHKTLSKICLWNESKRFDCQTPQASHLLMKTYKQL